MGILDNINEDTPYLLQGLCTTCNTVQDVWSDESPICLTCGSENIEPITLENS